MSGCRGHRTNDSALQAVHKLLASAIWLPTLNTREHYIRKHDEADGNCHEHLAVTFTNDTDAWVWVSEVERVSKALRFREPMGGGRSPRVRNALLVLAEAIRLDNEDEERRRSQSRTERVEKGPQ